MKNTIVNLQMLKEVFREINTPVFGAGVYAFYRLGLEDIVPNYRILALRDSLDTKLIEKDIEVVPLERGMGTRHINEPRNTTTVVSHPETKKRLEKVFEPAILVRNSSSKMENACRENDWLLLANDYKTYRKTFENKVNFRRILKENKISIPPGKTPSPAKLHYGHLMNTYGLPFVIQHPTKGGGKGTFFINNQEDFEATLVKLKAVTIDEDGEEKKIAPPEKIIVSQFIHGPSPSMTVCVTRHGILSTNIQHQILDIPELSNPERGSGLFCGHDWASSDFSQKAQEQAYSIAEKVGQYFKEKGYVGIFGLDFVMDKKTEKLYVTECNPRLLASFPTINMGQMLNNEPPILAFHVLEFLKADYDLDVEAVNKLMRQKKKGAQMILHNLTGRWARNHKELKAGVYKLRDGKLKYLRPGYGLKHLKTKEEFLLTDGVPFRRSHFSPNRRICRVLTLNGMLDMTTRKQLTPWAREVATIVYKAFDMRPVRFMKFKKFFFPDLLAKG